MRLEVPESPVVVRGDGGQLEQVVVNLLLNALEALGGGGEVTVRLARRPGEVAGRVCLEIRDSGPGLPAEGRERIFDPFFTTKPEGSGLGLPISFNIVRQHGGDLSLEDHPEGGMVARLLLAQGHQVVQAGDAATALKSARESPPDTVLLDLQLPDRTGLEILPELGRAAPAARVIMMTAHGSIPSAVQAMREGAWDYVSKPFDNDELLARLRRIEELRGLHVEVDALRAELEARYGLDELVGASPRMAEVLKTIRKVGPVEATVLVQGESGTGKELVARAIHRVSPRGRRPFVAVNCGAIPATLVEDSFFGHARGAFTDAREARAGFFEQVEGGTLFLDEIAELPVESQATLLRVLQEKTFSRIGDSGSRKADFRLVAATNVDLEEAVAAHRFREDLFWRLNMITLRVPPLRERAGDIPALADHLLEKWAAELRMPVKRLAPAASDLLCRHGWPGNVRELENTLYRALVMSEGAVIRPADLPARVSGASGPWPGGEEEGEAERSLEELVGEATGRVEAAVIRERLRRFEGHRTRTAASLGIGRKTLFNKMRLYAIDGPPGSPED